MRARASATCRQIPVEPLDTKAAAAKYAGPCVPVALAMIARGYGMRREVSDTALIDELARVGGTPPMPILMGTPQDGKFKILRHLDLAWEQINGFNLEWLRGHLLAGRMAIVGGKRSVLPRGDGDSGGHAVVVNGMSQDGRTFYFSDSTGFHNTPLSAEELREFVMTRPGEVGTIIAVYRPAKLNSTSATFAFLGDDS